jgi:hypothetical protein
MLANLPPSGGVFGPWYVDLLRTVPTNEPDVLLQCDLTDFPGYSQVPINFGNLAPDPIDPVMYSVISDFCTWERTTSSGPTSNATAVGYVVTDYATNVLYFVIFDQSLRFVHAGDYLNLSLRIGQPFDYP